MNPNRSELSGFAAPYLGCALVFGLFLGFVALINSQGSGSSSEVVTAFMGALVAPMPMLLLAFAFWRGFRWAPRMTSIYPVVTALLFAISSLDGRPMSDLSGVAYQFRMFVIGQIYFLPAATILCWRVRVKQRKIAADIR